MAASMGPRRLIGDRLDTSCTHTERAVKHTALGTFGSMRLVDDRDGFRLRAAAITLRQVASAAGSESHAWEVCLISSSNRTKVGVWKMPGGGVEKGEDPSAAAEREVIEEAGLKGTVVQALGVYQNNEKKTRTQWFVMSVTGELATWEEGELGRLRKWFPIDDAYAVLPSDYHRMLLRQAVDAIESKAREAAEGNSKDGAGRVRSGCVDVHTGEQAAERMHSRKVEEPDRCIAVVEDLPAGTSMAAPVQIHPMVEHVPALCMSLHDEPVVLEG